MYNSGIHWARRLFSTATYAVVILVNALRKTHKEQIYYRMWQTINAAHESVHKYA